MPTFFGYIFWSARWLLPVLVASMMIFVVDSPTLRRVGIGVAALLVVRALLLLRGKGIGIPPKVPDRAPRKKPLEPHRSLAYRMAHPSSLVNKRHRDPLHKPSHQAGYRSVRRRKTLHGPR
jgi:hypothetical protein